jgi:uncharacterized DUF497 family protein
LEPSGEDSAMTDFEWDPEKELKNIEKHKVDFRTACRIWEGIVRSSRWPADGRCLYVAWNDSPDHLCPKGEPP